MELNDALGKWYSCKNRKLYYINECEEYEKAIEEYMNEEGIECINEGEFKVEKKKVSYDYLNRDKMPPEIIKRYTTKKNSFIYTINQNETKSIMEKKYPENRFKRWSFMEEMLLIQNVGKYKNDYTLIGEIHGRTFTAIKKRVEKLCIDFFTMNRASLEDISTLLNLSRVQVKKIVLKVAFLKRRIKPEPEDSDDDDLIFEDCEELKEEETSSISYYKYDISEILNLILWLFFIFIEIYYLI